MPNRQQIREMRRAKEKQVRAQGRVLTVLRTPEVRLARLEAGMDEVFRILKQHRLLEAKTETGLIIPS